MDSYLGLVIGIKISSGNLVLKNFEIPFLDVESYIHFIKVVIHW